MYVNLELSVNKEFVAYETMIKILANFEPVIEGRMLLKGVFTVRVYLPVIEGSIYRKGVFTCY